MTKLLNNGLMRQDLSCKGSYTIISNLTFGVYF